MNLLWLAAILLASMASPADAQGVEVSLTVEIRGHRAAAHGYPGAAVVWLSPLQKTLVEPAHPKQEYRLSQRDRQFFPHLLIVPVGSSVDFPNLDPFFHNVFSLFNGRRFDLGLYEGHSSRKVQFDREGVSYIFCNIHPGMGAVVVSLDTPYYGLSDAEGLVQMHNVPPGSYRLNVWAEDVPLDRLGKVSRVVEISASAIRLGTLSLETTGDVMSHHLNKFGEDYPVQPKAAY